MGSYYLTVPEFLCGVMGRFWEEWWSLHNTVNVMNATELITHFKMIKITKMHAVCVFIT